MSHKIEIIENDNCVNILKFYINYDSNVSHGIIKL